MIGDNDNDDDNTDVTVGDGTAVLSSQSAVDQQIRAYAIPLFLLKRRYERKEEVRNMTVVRTRGSSTALVAWHAYHSLFRLVTLHQRQRQQHERRKRERERERPCAWIYSRRSKPHTTAGLALSSNILLLCFGCVTMLLPLLLLPIIHVTTTHRRAIQHFTSHHVTSCHGGAARIMALRLCGQDVALRRSWAAHLRSRVIAFAFAFACAASHSCD